MFVVNDTITGLAARLTFPRKGIWQADVKLDTDEELAGPARINIDDGKVVLNGTVLRAGAWVGTGYVRVVGGAGGLSKIATPRHYSGPSVGVVLSDLLRQAGETRSGTSDASVLGRRLDAWTTSAIPIGQVISLLLKTAVGTGEATWRVLPDGTVWVGIETWPDSGLVEDVDYQTLAEDPGNITARLGVETPLVFPGMSLGGRKVSYVDARLDSPATRVDVWFEAGAPAADDRLRRALAAAVKAANPRVEYSAPILAQVVSQKGDRIDVKPLDPARPPMANVRLMVGLPQWKIHLAPGGLVAVGWSAADPSQPYVIGFGPDVIAQVLTLICPALTLQGESVTIDSPAAKVGAPSAAYELMPKWQSYRAAQQLLNSGTTGWGAVLLAMAQACTGSLAPLQAGFEGLATLLAAFEALAATFTSQTSSNS